jgi:hypothetical protein
VVSLSSLGGMAEGITVGKIQVTGEVGEWAQATSVG